MDNDFNAINRLLGTYFWNINTGSSKVVAVDTDEFELVPKKSFIEKQIKGLEERLANIKSQKNAEMAAWNDRIVATETEIADLKKKL